MKTQNVNFRRLTAGAQSFGEALQILTSEAGLDRGRAILLARKYHPRLFNKWMSDRYAGRINEKRGGSSIMQHFRIIGG